MGIMNLLITPPFAAVSGSRWLATVTPTCGAIADSGLNEFAVNIISPVSARTVHTRDTES